MSINNLSGMSWYQTFETRPYIGCARFVGCLNPPGAYRDGTTVDCRNFSSCRRAMFAQVPVLSIFK
jgi:hypothetical protein